MADWPTIPAGAAYPLVNADTGAFLSTKVNEALSTAIAAAIAAAGGGGGYVYHGDDASFPRPDTTSVLVWVGSVRPINMEYGDIWFVSTEQAVEPPVDWLVNLDASTLALPDASAVATWADLSGNGYNATQADSTKRPIFYVAAGGQPAFVRFDGANDFLATSAFSGGAISQPFTVVAAVRADVIDATIRSFFGSSDASVGRVSARTRVVSGTERWEIYGGSSGAGLVTTYTAAPDVWVVLTMIFNGGSSKIRINGVEYATFSNIGTGTLNGITLGSDYNGAAPFTGDVYALKVRAGVAPTQIADVEQALMDACGIG